VRLLFVGGDFRRKGGPLLLECMRGSLGERCELHVVTGEPISSSSNVIVHNGLGPNSPELLRLFEEADLLVLPSMAECLAVVLMEAAAAALPIIATDVGALSEAVQHSETGMLIRAGDIRSLERAITALVDNSRLRQQMSHRVHALARLRIDAQANGLEIFDLIAAVAADDLNARRAA
jgi:glycosyltransferase involved in cell wall biosynthesis